MPTRTRNLTGLALQAEQGRDWCLIDCGEATQHQLLRTHLSLRDLQAIFITHVHGDHCYGLPGLLASAGAQGRTAPLPIIGPAGIHDWLRATAQTIDLALPFELQHHPVESLPIWLHRHWSVQPIELSHRVPSYAYSFTEATQEASLDLERLSQDGIPQGPLWGALQRGEAVQHEGRLLQSRDYICHRHPRRRVVVAGDNDRPELLWDVCRQAQVLVHEATYTEAVALQVGGRGHTAAADIAQFAEVCELPNLVLTHFSSRYQSEPGGIHCLDDIRHEARGHYRGRLFLAEDFARFRLGKSGRLVRS